RINSLAAQYFAFSTLAIVILGAAIVIAAALSMSPLGFLSVIIVVALAAFVGVVRVARTALRSSANPVRAASLADDRSGLKGRLLTVLLMSDRRRNSDLWRYLVEDTYGRRTEFEPGKIEPRWFSRAIFALLGACIVAFILMRIAPFRFARHPLQMSGLPNRVTADLGNLDIRPADPALEPNAEIYADPATLKKLADKLAAAQGNQSDKDQFSRWLNKARNFADTLQNKITGQGHRSPLELRLTDKEASSTQEPHPPHGLPPTAGSSGSNGTAPGKSTGSQAMPTPGQGAGQLAQNGIGSPGQTGSDSGQANPSDLGSPVSGGTGNGNGVSHGSGSDPEHLFGPPSSQPLGSDSFKITIDAQPSDESSTPGAPAYVPPKVKAPLNDRQYGDEPIARASVPVADQMTVKRVFER
ncbi:MAG TPA: hypothetical protein VJ728_04475, partial [Candidatus Binataceae bacterium]|nr:hypothetical protein [Candidatus Binataceae bacterium]